MNKKKRLEDIAREIEECEVCKEGKGGKPVPGEGSPDAKIMFIGEAPGKQESLTGRPFIGRSGKLLREHIKRIGLKEDEVYITSPVKYLPDRGTPNKEDILHGMSHLKKQFEVIKPETIVLLGSVAAQGVLGEKLMVMKRRGEILHRDGRKVFLTIHPAAAVRFKKYQSALKEDFDSLRRVLKG